MPDITHRERTTWRRPWLVCVVAVALGSAAPLGAKRKDDAVVLLNGDRLVGEIKRLSQGELEFKTAYILNSFHIDWRQIQELTSQDEYRVEVNNGVRLTGTIARQADGSFTVVTGATSATFAAVDIVSIVPIETSFWAQLTGQVNSGFSYTSGESQTQFSASGSVAYVADTYAFYLTGSSTFGHSEGDTTNTKRNTVELFNSYSVSRQWFAAALVGLLNSEQQDLELRATVGGGAGRWLARTEYTRFSTFAGLVYTHEQYTVADAAPPGETMENLEGVAGLQYAFHRFKTTNVDAQLTVYPSLTTARRVRLSVAPTLNIEIVRNLYWTFTLYENYDSHPPVNAPKNDFGITNSIGWKF